MAYRETEVKFKVSDFRAIRPMLKALGGRVAWRGTEQTFYFDTRRGALRKQGASLRLRIWGSDSAVSLTYKGKQMRGGRFKVREELQTTLGSLPTGRLLLRRLGFVEKLRYEKRREHWVLGTASVELDTLAGHRFVEIEGTRAAIERIARRLGLDWKCSTTASYPDLIRRGSRNNKNRLT